MILLSFSGVCLGTAFAQTETQAEAQAASLAQARRDQEEQIVRLVAEIEKVKEQQRLILEEISRTKKFVG